MNYPQEMFAAFKKGIYPDAAGDDEKRLRVAFYQGMHSGRELTLQSSSLPNRELIEFHRDLKGQINAELSLLGYVPGKVSIGTRPKPIVKATINGEDLP